MDTWVPPDGRSRRTRSTGLLVSLAGVLLLSPDAVLIRAVEADEWTVLFWRGLLSAFSLLLLSTALTKGRPWEMVRTAGRPGLAVGVLMAIASTFFVLAVTHTTAANALVVFSTSPLFAALLTRVFLRERMRGITWISAVVVLGAVAAIFRGGVGGSGFAGDLAALGGALAHAGALTVARAAREVNMMPGVAFGGVGAALIACIFGVALPGGADIALLLLLGGVLLPAAVTLIMMGPRHLPAPEVSIITRLEVLFGAFWVWLFLGEAPSGRTVASGTVILLTLSVHTLLSTGRALPSRR